jgi:CPA1 family monovalent cation:H+ antiporter
MTGFENALWLLLLTTALSVIGRWLPWPQPITYVLGAIGMGIWPLFPHIELEPEFFFLCFVPPLLFSDGWLMPLREFAKARRPIISLSIGLVLFTTVSVGYFAHWLVPGLPLAMAFALGAVLSPTDAIAVSAITARLKVPARLTTVLQGESLMNDATGLVAFKLALATLAAGVFSLRDAALDFSLLAGVGTAVGLASAYAVGRMRDLLRHLRGSDPFIETTISLMTPYAAYLLAGALGGSGILAVVAAGLYSGWRDPVRMDVESRQTSWTVWATVLFWLNGLAFVLLGLQFPVIFRSVNHLYSTGTLVLFTLSISAIVIIGRIAWVFPGAYLPFLLSAKVRRTEQRPSWQSVLVAGWAGMRGTVTLAAALSIPLWKDDGHPFPARELVIFLSFGVIVVTLLLQGTTLEWLICRLGLREDDTKKKEDRLARIAAVEAGLKALTEDQNAAATPEESVALGKVVSEYETRLAELVADGATRENARVHRSASRIHRLKALRAERAALDDLWRRDVINDDTHRPLLQLLDQEESMLSEAPE